MVDRELVLAALSVGALVPVGAYVLARLPPLDADDPSARRLERAALRRVLAPLVPPLLCVTALVGFTVVEDERVERVPPLALFFMAVVLVPWIRAIVRAFRSLRAVDVRTAATIGFVRPRIVVHEGFRRELDERALDAVLAHERAHARHHDPLRLWLVQFAADLQWPFVGAEERFATWQEALELARDEEARESVDGADLAAGILAAARHERGRRVALAGIVNRDRDFEARIARLLSPLVPAPEERGAWARSMSFVGVVVLCLVLGATYGDWFLTTGLGWGA